MKHQENLLAIDLFCGAGGLSQGLKSAGFRIVAAVESDSASASSYQLNHTDTLVFEKDIRHISGPELLSCIGLKRGELDLLTGCPPCQGFSTLKTRNKGFSIFDTRNDLAFQFLRLVRSMRPKAVVLENVPGFVADIRFEEFTKGLTNSGYKYDYAVLEANEFGIPQRRKRLVLVAWREPYNISQDWKFPKEIENVFVKHAIFDLPPAGLSGDPLHDYPEKRSATVMDRIRAVPKDGGSRTDLPPFLQLDCHKKSNGYSDVYGRMAWNKPSPTITSGCTNPSKGRFLHPSADRAITLREAALLQTFPSEYEFDLSFGKEEVARQIGNAFPPTLIKPIGEHLAKGLMS